MTQHPCPSESALSDAFTDGGDDALYDHLATCAACAAKWADLDDLRDLASELSSPELSGAQIEATRASLLTRLETKTPVRKVGRRTSYVIPAFAAVAVALLVSAGIAFWVGGMGSEGSGASAPKYLSTIHALEDARYARVSGAPNEIVRLNEGRITVAVAKLGGGQRLRVLTGDAEVEVRGTVFDVEARDDALVLVRVIEGVVEVRRDGATTTLKAGERWDAPARAAALPKGADPTDANSGGPDKPLEVAGGTGDDAKIEVAGGTGDDAKIEVAGGTGDDAKIEVAGGMGDDARPEAGDKAAAPRAKLASRNSRPKAAAGVARRPGRHARPGRGAEEATGRSEPRRDASLNRGAEDSGPARVVPADVVEEVEARPMEKAPPASEPVPTEAEAHFQEGWRALEAGEHGAAATAFEQVGDKAPAGTLSADAAFWRAVALDRAGRSTEAEAALAAYLKSWPRSRRSGAARAMLGWKRLAAGDAKAARLLFGASVNDPSPNVRHSARAGLEAADAKLRPSR